MLISTDLRLDTPAATATLGKALSRVLRAGDILLLEGDLGAGKTTLARAIIAELTGIKDAASPTYTIVQTYDCADGTPLWHADLYRLEEADELEELGFDDAFDTAITLIEWPDRLGHWTPRDYLAINLRLDGDGTDSARIVTLSGHGDWEGRLATITQS